MVGLALVLSTLSLAAALRARGVERLLLAADAEMDRDPRQALALLDSLDAERLCGRAQRAKYALLYTQAQDKNYIDETDDSLIRVASDYYESRGSVRDRFRMLYYRGRICVNRGDLSRAMIAFMEAEQLIRDVNDPYLAGLLYVQMGNIYKRYYDYHRALKAYRMAYAYYLNTNRELHQYHALMDIGLMYLQIKDLEPSEAAFRQVLSYACYRDDALLKKFCYGNLIVLLNQQRRFSETAVLFDSLLQVGGGHHASAMWASEAYRYASLKQVDRARRCLEQAVAVAKNTNDSLLLFYYKSLVYRRLENHAVAYSGIVASIRIQDSLLRYALQQPILSTQRDALQQKLEYQSYRMVVERRFRFFYSVCALLLVAMLMAYLYLRLRKKDEEILRWMEMFRELQQHARQEHSEMAAQINELYMKQFEFINQLGEAYYEHAADAGRKERIYRDVETRIMQLSEDAAKLRELERIINRYKQDAVRHLRAEFPDLKQHELYHICYLFAGFSPNMISVLLRVRIGTVYKRSSRLKARIQASDAPHKALFLGLLANKPLKTRDIGA